MGNGRKHSTESAARIAGTFSLKRLLAKNRGQWVALVLLSLLLGFLLHWSGIPGAALIGPLLAGIAVALRFGVMQAPPLACDLAQTVVFFFVATVITPEILRVFFQDSMVFLGAVFAAILLSVCIGLMLARLRWFPVSEAILGCVPGAAAAILPMSQVFGADVRLVAVIQYTRFLLVTLTMVVAGKVYLATSESAQLVSAIGTSGFDPARFLVTMALALAAGLCGHLLPYKSAPFLVPLLVGMTVCGLDLYTFELPAWLVLPCFAVVGWSIGLQFDMASFRYAVKSMPKIILAGLLLMGGCALIAMALTLLTGVDFMSAYLATTPGGVDAAVILAAGADMDVSFVACLQVTRLVCMMIIGPPLIQLTLKYFG